MHLLATKLRVVFSYFNVLSVVVDPHRIGCVLLGVFSKYLDETERRQDTKLKGKKKMPVIFQGGLH